MSRLSVPQSILRAGVKPIFLKVESDQDSLIKNFPWFPTALKKEKKKISNLISVIQRFIHALAPANLSRFFFFFFHPLTLWCVISSYCSSSNSLYTFPYNTPSSGESLTLQICLHPACYYELSYSEHIMLPGPSLSGASLPPCGWTTRPFLCYHSTCVSLSDSMCQRDQASHSLLALLDHDLGKTHVICLYLFRVQRSSCPA